MQVLLRNHEYFMSGPFSLHMRQLRPIGSPGNEVIILQPNIGIISIWKIMIYALSRLTKYIPFHKKGIILIIFIDLHAAHSFGLFVKM